MTITKLASGQQKKAARVAAAAFFNYPMMRHYFPNEKKRKERLTWYMDKTLKTAVRYGEVFTADDCNGVLFLLPPGHTRLTDAEYIRCGFLFAPIVLGLRNYLMSSECEKFVADTHERLLASRAHYYLWGLVTHPKAQGTGVGSALLRMLCDRADEEKLPIYLETHEEKNVGYYERFGFSLVHTDSIPKHGLPIWCMLREAT